VTKVPSTAFVTGGSGFIGGALVRRLVAEGCSVKALARSERSADSVSELGAEPVRGDLSDLGAIEAGATGCETAFHLAAHLGTWGKRADFMRDNVEGTENALARSRAAGVRRFVHCGTEAALIAGEPLIEVDETTRLRPDSKALYPATKALAEQAVRGASADGFETVVLRPRFVWGAGDTTLLPGILSMVEKGRFAWIGGGGQLTDTTHVDNVVEGLLLAAEKGRAGEAYFVTDGDRVVFRKFVTAMIETQGVEPPTRTVPAAVAGPLAAAAESTWRLLHLGGEPPLTRFAVWISSQECTINISKARADLGYEPIKDRESGLAELERRLG
jgi:nucleoside-diphosphate-sugar epimerase